MNLINGFWKPRDKNIEIKNLRTSSYPYISGDTFRASASVFFEQGDCHTNVVMSKSSKNKIFIDVDSAQNSIVQTEILNKLNFQLGKSNTRVPVIIHNGDGIVSDRFVERLISEGAEIFAVNFKESSPHLNPIPIGLENSHLRTNGEISDFIEFSLEVSPDVNRSGVLCAFNVSTNPHIREPLMATFSKSRHKHEQKRLDPSDFRTAIKASRFVISPPGNGADCHRTWEAIYLGAVPVIHRKFLAESLWQNLPIWAVEDWAEFFEATDSELDNKFYELTSKETDMAFADYWIAEMDHS